MGKTEMRIEDWIDRHAIIIMAVLVFVCQIILLLFLRFSNTTTYIGYDAYQEIENIRQKENLLYSAFNYLLSATSLPVIWLTPFILGVLNLLLIGYLLTEVLDAKLSAVSLILIAVSPIYLHQHSIFGVDSFILFFLTAGTLMLVKDRYVLALFAYILSFLLSPQSILLVIIILINYYYLVKGKSFLIPLAALVLLFAMLRVNISPSLQVSDLGADMGFSLFNLLLFVIGIALSWEKKQTYGLVYITLLLAFVLGIDYYLFMLVPVTVFSALTFVTLIESKWTSQTLKNYVVLLLICGIMFSSGSYITKLSKEGPSESETLSLAWLGKRAGDQTVLSHYRFGALIETVANKKSYVDLQYYKASQDKLKIAAAEQIFQSRNLKEVLDFFRDNEVKYVWINEAMKTGLVWNESEQGLLFIMGNSNQFNRIYNYKGSEIWELSEPAIENKTAPN